MKPFSTLMNRRLQWGVALVALALPSLAEAQTNLITNGDFSSNAGNGSTPTGWTKDFNSYGAYGGNGSTMLPRTASWTLHAGLSAGTGGEYQDVATTSGRSYLVTLWMQGWADNYTSGFDSLMRQQAALVVGGSGSSAVTLGSSQLATTSATVAVAAPTVTNFLAQGRILNVTTASPWYAQGSSFTASGTTTRIGLYNVSVVPYRSGVNFDDIGVYAANDWTTDTDASWSTTSNWADGTAPNAAGAIAAFSGTATAPRTITLDSGATVGALIFRNANAYTLSGANTLTLSGTYAASTGPMVTVNSGSHTIATAVAVSSGTLTPVFAIDQNTRLALAGNVSGSTGIVKSGYGTLLLSGSNTYTGATTITNGVVQFANPSALYGGVTASWTPANISVGASGMLAVNVGGSGEFDATAVATLLTSLSAVNNNGLRAGSTIGLDTSTTGSFTYSNAIVNSTGTGGGAIGLTKLGTGQLTLTGTNTYTGATTVNAGTLVFGGTQAKAPGTVTAAAAGTIGLGVGGANSYTSANVAALFGNTLTGFSMNAASGVAVDTTGGNFTVSDALAGTRAFTKLGPNTLTLSGNNTFSGAFTVSEGGISIATINNASANGPLGNSASAVVLGSSGKAGTLEYTGATASSTKPFTAVAGGTAAFSVTNAAAVLTLSGAIDGDGDKSFGGAGSYVLSGGLGGTGTVFKTGAGSLTLNQAGHAGGYQIQAGRLNLNDASAIGNATALALGPGIELDNASGGAVTINNSGVAISLGTSLTFLGTQNLNMGGGIVTLGATSAIAVNSGTLTFGGNVGDGGNAYGITKSGAGTLVLSGLTGSAFTGNSVISAGELYLSGTSTLGGTVATTVTVQTGATLRVGPTASKGAVTLLIDGGQVLYESLQDGPVDFTANSVLNSSNAFANGVQTIAAGVVVSSAEDWIGSIPGAATQSRIVMENGAVLRSTQAININANKGIELSGASATFDADTGSIFIDSQVTGTGALVKTGTGGFRILNQSNSYSGGTEIREGTFGIYGDGSLGQAGTRVLIDGATLNSGQGTSGQTVTVESARSIVLGNGKTSNLDATNGSTLAYAGVITEENAEGTAASLRIGSASPARDGTVLLGGANTYRGDTIINSGTLKLASGGSFANSALIVVGDAGSSNAVFDLTEKSTFAIGAGQTLKGKGTVLLGPSTALTINGLLSPGNSPGLLTYDGGGTVALSGTTLMEVWGTSRGANPGYDAIDLINGTDLTFGGILNLDFNQLFADGTTFNLFTPDGTSTLAGTFSSITMVGSSYTDLTFTNNAGFWTTNTGTANQSMTFNSATGTLSIIVVPEPAGVALAAIGAATAVALRRRRRREAVT